MLQQWLDHLTTGDAVEWLRAAGLAAAVAAAAFLLILFLQRLFLPLHRLVRAQKGSVIRGITVGSFRLVSEESVVSLLFTLLRAVRFFLSAVVVYQAVKISVSFFPWGADSIVEETALGAVSALFVIIVSAVLIRGMLSLHRLTEAKLDAWRTGRTEKVVGLQILSTARIVDGLLGVNSLVRVVGFTMTLYLTATLVFDQFTVTAAWSHVLWGYIVFPLAEMYRQFVEYLPNLFTVFFILLVVRYLLKLVRFLFYEAEQGSIVIPGFHPEWAEPTYQISRFLIFVFTAVVVFPYLPGSNSPFFQGISVFVGVLLSFGSSSAISNIVSGTVLTYMRPFKRGDVVCIGETTGEVIEKSLLVTRVRTPKNVDVTIPNSAVLSGQIRNYSALTGGPGLILNTTVTIGYDVPWRQVHDLLIAAAKKSEGIRATPEPFVLQTSLNDSHVSYELNAFTDVPVVMPRLYSELHRNIQDAFAAAGVEIMSPLYAAVRDGNPSTLPAAPKRRKR